LLLQFGGSGGVKSFYGSVVDVLVVSAAVVDDAVLSFVAASGNLVLQPLMLLVFGFSAFISFIFVALGDDVVAAFNAVPVVLVIAVSDAVIFVKKFPSISTSFLFLLLIS
jgi:hypothetical protein